MFSFFLITIILIGLNVFLVNNFTTKNTPVSSKQLQKKQLINNVSDYFQKYSNFLAFGSEMDFDFKFLFKLLGTKDNQNKLFFMRKIKDDFPVVSFENIESSEDFLKIFNEAKKQKLSQENVLPDKELIPWLVNFRQNTSKIKNAVKISENFLNEQQVANFIKNLFILNKDEKSFNDIIYSSYFDKIIEYSEKIMLFWYNFIPNIKEPVYELYLETQDTKEKKLFNLFTYIKQNHSNETDFWNLIKQSVILSYQKINRFQDNETKKEEEIENYINFLENTQIKNPFEEKAYHINKFPNQLSTHFTNYFIAYLVKDFLKKFEISLKKINSLNEHGNYLYWKVLHNNNEKTFTTFKNWEDKTIDPLTKNEAIIEIKKQNLDGEINEIRCFNQCNDQQKKTTEEIIENYWSDFKKQKSENISEANTLFWKNIFSDFFVFNDWKSKFSNFLSFFWIQKIINESEKFNSELHQSVSFFYQNLNFQDVFFDQFYSGIKKELSSKLDDENSLLRQILIDQIGSSEFKIINSFKDNEFISRGLSVLETTIKGTFSLLKKEFNNIFQSTDKNYQLLKDYFEKNSLENVLVSIPHLLWKHRSFLNKKIVNFKTILIQYKKDTENDFSSIDEDHDFYQNTELRIKLLSEFINFIYQIWEKIFKNLENYELKIIFFVAMQILYKTKMIVYEKKFFNFFENFTFLIEPDLINLVLKKINRFFDDFKKGYQDFVLNKDHDQTYENFQKLLIALGFNQQNSQFKNPSFFGNLINSLNIWKENYKPKNEEEEMWKLIFTNIIKKNGILDQILFFVSDFLEQNFYYYLQFSNWKIKNPSNIEGQYQIIFNNDQNENDQNENPLDFDVEFITIFRKNSENIFSYFFRWNFLETDDGYRFRLKKMEKLYEKN